MKKFRKRPVVIEAIQWTGENFQELHKWGGGGETEFHGRISRTYDEKCLAVQGRELWLSFAQIDDWIIKDMVGKFRVCKPTVFEATFEIEEPSN